MDKINKKDQLKYYKFLNSLPKKINKLYFGKTKITDISPIIECINESFRIHFSESIMPEKLIQLFEEYENEGIIKYYKEYAR